MFSTQKSYVSRVRDARTEPLRLPQTKQIQSLTVEVYKTDTATGADCIAEAQGEYFHMLFYLMSDKIYI